MTDGIRILQGHVLDRLKDIKAESVQCCVTSPPYYSLRAYSGEQDQIWDGDPDCEHVWGKRMPDHHPGQVPDGKSVHSENSKGQTAGSGQYCQRCGAWKGALGLEPSPTLYVKHLVDIFGEVRRTLRKDGTVWVNLGDTYASSRGGTYQPAETLAGGVGGKTKNGEKTNRDRHSGFNPSRDADRFGLKHKDLIGVPWRFALAMQADGWWLRQSNVWAKGVSYCDEYSGSAMPESVNGVRWERCKRKTGKRKDGLRSGRADPDSNRNDADWKAPVYESCPGCEKCCNGHGPDGYVLRKGSWRNTSAYEYVFMFAKSDKYFCDKEAVIEGGSDNAHGGGVSGEHRYNIQSGRNDGGDISKGIPAKVKGGRNPRNVWTIGTAGFGGSHFAVFSEDLVEPCIKSSTSEKACGVCGAPYAPVVEKHTESTYEKVKDKTWKQMNEDAQKKGIVPSRPNSGQTRLPNGTQPHLDGIKKSVIEYAPTCHHDDDTGKCVVLDPFFGRGTTGFVARRLGREAVGVELSPDYVKIAEEWIQKRMSEEKVVENENLSKVFS